ncbi:MAG: hypothetical protein EZS28_029895, partial [Streblomastix strix]
MSQAPTSDLHRQHLKKLNKDVVKGDVSKGTGGALYEIPPGKKEMPLGGPKATANYSFNKNKAERDEEEKKKEQQRYRTMISKIAFGEDRGYNYDNYPAQPLITFFPLLVRKTTAAKHVPITAKLCIPIPDTFVFLQKDELRWWLITSDDGCLEKIEQFTNRDMMLAIGRPRGRENELTAVMKVKTRKGLNNELTILNTEDLKNLIISPPANDYILQRFIQAKGLHPWFTRVVWNYGQAAIAYNIQGRNLFSDDTEGDFRKRFSVCTDVVGHATVFKTSGIGVAEPIGITETIVNYVQRQHGIHLQQMACDFIKDANDKWWFLQVKAFRVMQDTLDAYKALIKEKKGDQAPDVMKLGLIPKANRKQEYVRLVRCKSCNAQFPMEDLVHELTMKMILQTINHLTHRGVRIPFFERTDLKVRGGETGMTRIFKVCNSCYDLFNSEKQLAKLEANFAKALGINIISNDLGEMQVVEPDTQLISVVTQTPKEIEKAHPKLQLFRLLICIYEVFNLPPGEYQLAYQLMGSTVTYPLLTEVPPEELFLEDSEKVESMGVLNKFRVHYFFADPDCFEQFLHKEQQAIRVVCLRGRHRRVGGNAPLPTQYDREAILASGVDIDELLNGGQEKEGQEEEEDPWPMTSTHQLYGDNKKRKVKDGGEGALTNANKTQSGFGSTQKSSTNKDGQQGEDGSTNQAKALTPEVAAAFVGEFPVSLLAFNSQNEKGRMDLMVNMVHCNTEEMTQGFPQLKVTLAFSPCQFDMLAKTDLWQSRGVFVPHKAFFTCEPLPDDWVLLLPQNKAMQTRAMKFFPKQGYSKQLEQSTEEEGSSSGEEGGEAFFNDDIEHPLPVFREHAERLERKKHKKGGIDVKKKFLVEKEQIDDEDEDEQKMKDEFNKEVPAGKVTVTVISVANVTPVDLNGKADPYIKCIIGKDEKRTEKKADTLEA